LILPDEELRLRRLLSVLLLPELLRLLMDTVVAVVAVVLLVL